MRTIRRLACTLVVACLTSSAFSQEFRATVNGRVTDPSKAVIPNATVTVRNTQTNETATVATNSEGNYTVPFLKPGIYSLTVEAAGFKKHQRDRQELQVSQTATIDFELEVGTTSESITVTAEAALLEESKADRGTVIDNRKVTELPLNARNPFMLSTLVAGITYNGPAIYQRPFDNGAIADWSINGGQNRNNEFLLDGAPNNSIQGGNNIAYVPPVDAVQEFKIITNSYDAQYGRTAGGVINVSLKSGTNKLHGSVYEFARRNFLDSNTLLGNARGIPAGKAKNPDGSFSKAEHFLDQYGFQVDGPVYLPWLYNGRNKTFFLFNYEGYREGTPNPAVRTVPTQEFLRGDFSNLRDAQGNLIVIYDPATGRRVGSNWVRDPFPGNRIPDNRIHPIARKLAALFPAPNTTTPGTDPWRNNFADIPNIANDKFHNWVFKVDQSIGNNDRMFFRYGYNQRKEIRWTNGIIKGPAQDGQLPLVRTNHTGVFDWLHTLSSNVVINLRASGNRYIEEARTEAGFGFDATELGFPKTLVDQLPVKLFPRINSSDFISLGRGSFSKEPTNVLSLQPNVTWNKGDHNVRFGLDMRLTQYSRQVSGNAGIALSFDRTFTQKEFNRGDSLSGNSIAAMLLGAPTSGNIDFNAFPIFMWKYYAPWIQDDWKINQRLTLNFGLRWDFNSPIVERFNRLNRGFDPNVVNPVSARIDQTKFPSFKVLGGLGFAGVDGNPSYPYQYDKNNFQPRIGAAYRLNDKTVIRGGFGQYYLNPTGTSTNNGFSISTPFVASLDGNQTSLFNLGNPFPTGVIQPPGSSRGLETFLGNGFGYSSLNFVTPYVRNFSLGLQRQLGWNTVVEMSYVGSRTYKEQNSYGGINEPTLDFRNKCDITKGGTRAFCDERLPNPFFGVRGFEGTSRFTSTTLSRYDLNRPFPQFGGITEFERNDGRIWYNSFQAVLNKRFSRGLTLNGTYTMSKMIEENGFVDDLARTINRSPYFSDRPHRITVSGVYDVPFGKGRRFLPNLNGIADRIIGGWEVAGSWIYQSGRPWDLPGNVDYLKDAKLKGSNQKRVLSGVEFIQGVRPCVEQLNTTTGKYELKAYSVQYGCTEANFRVREPFGTRTIAFRDSRLRRPSFKQFDMNFAKNTRITESTRLQLRFEAYNVLNSPMYDERQFNTDTNSTEFGSINKNTTVQSNFPRQIQLGVKFIF